jgi:hypothetical protein
MKLHYLPAVTTLIAALSLPGSGRAEWVPPGSETTVVVTPTQSSRSKKLVACTVVLAEENGKIVSFGRTKYGSPLELLIPQALQDKKFFFIIINRLTRGIHRSDSHTFRRPGRYSATFKVNENQRRLQRVHIDAPDRFPSLPETPGAHHWYYNCHLTPFPDVRIDDRFVGGDSFWDGPPDADDDYYCLNLDSKSRQNHRYLVYVKYDGERNFHRGYWMDSYDGYAKMVLPRWNHISGKRIHCRVYSGEWHSNRVDDLGLELNDAVQPPTGTRDWRLVFTTGDNEPPPAQDITEV